MATKSFLSPVELEQAERHLVRPPFPPDGNENRDLGSGPKDFSLWLGERLLERLQKYPDWLAAEPVILGSWSRGELSAKSDIDLLFLGSEEKVMALVSAVSRDGLKLRYRVPADPEDWSKGVLPFDILALFSARGLTDHAQEKLQQQLLKIRKTQRNTLLKAMKEERKVRALRFDSIANYLEPNIKYGPGGLRDLEQALMVQMLYPERFAGAEHAFLVLEYYKSFFLWVRHKLHLAGSSSDILAAHEQRPIAEWLGFKNPRDFMREIQKGLSRVSFYTDWAIAQATTSRMSIEKVEAAKLETVAALFDALEKEKIARVPRILWENRVRLEADRIFARVRPQDSEVNEQIGRRLTRMIDPMGSEEALLGLFRSRLMDHCLPEFRRIQGYVQHDQYHRYTVDAHLLQVLRELKRICQKPSRAGKLAPLVKALTQRDREVLAFACLLHDLAKGRGGDHSADGVELARRELARFGKSDKVIEEVCWIISEHLALSAAAFRENPSDPSTWRGLAEKGVVGDRIRLLTVFTVVDIIGTNPEAWTPWKERLLFELARHLESPEADAMVGLLAAARTADLAGYESLESLESLIQSLDHFLIRSIPKKVLIEDLRKLKKSDSQKKRPTKSDGLRLGDLQSDDIAISVYSFRRGGSQMWIRFYCPQDRAGLFMRFVQIMAAAGLGVRHASIHTDQDIGVYDWFEVKTSRTRAQVLKLLEGALRMRFEKQYQVRFDAIEFVSQDDQEWVISFRGRDQNGALAVASRALFEAGVEIRWAKVHTWGRQIDDVFGIKPLPKTNSMKELPEILREKIGILVDEN
jgi:[protein-PII] uridylyltransferase